MERTPYVGACPVGNTARIASRSSSWRNGLVTKCSRSVLRLALHSLRTLFMLRSSRCSSAMNFSLSFMEQVCFQLMGKSSLPRSVYLLPMSPVCFVTNYSVAPFPCLSRGQGRRVLTSMSLSSSPSTEWASPRNSRPISSAISVALIRAAI